MKQVVIKKGMATVINVQPTALESGTILVAIQSSCISSGTEISLLNSSGMSLLEKSKQNPEKVRAAFKRMKDDGVLSVLQKAYQKNNREIGAGYSAAGVVLDIAPDVYGFYKGMRVAVAGAGYAIHAELVVIPINLAIPIPVKVNFREASTCALGGIALQGVRRAETRLGEINAVFGCGAIGLLTVQLLKASGCIVVAIDLDKRRLELAKKLGADAIFCADKEEIVDSIVSYTGGYGVDKVIITASTNSNSVLSQAFKICRKKGRVVLVGVIGSLYNRDDMYSKELDFVISTSYGPGRYDEKYERHGHDYPYAYVRWTEKRNMEAYLRCIEAGSVKLDSIIEGTFLIDQAAKAYKKLKEEKLLLVNLEYPKAEENSNVKQEVSPTLKTQQWKAPKDIAIRMGIVGAGSFIQNTHIPNIKKMEDKYNVVSICTRSGLSAHQAAKNFSGCLETTNYDELLQSKIDMVMIGTRHNLHCEMAIRAIEAGKAVFVEKPMCITKLEYERLSRVIDENDVPFMVGYNRRYSPLSIKIHELVKNRINPIIMQYTMNAGYIPYSSWIHTDEGGGRIIGEACHIFDLFQFFVGFPAISVSVETLNPKTESVRPNDNAVITIKYEDGSIGTLLYTAIGTTMAEKESLKVFCDKKIFEMNDYKSLKTYGVSSDLLLKKQDKGHMRELDVFAEHIVNGKNFPIPWQALKETWEISWIVNNYVRTER